MDRCKDCHQAIHFVPRLDQWYHDRAIDTLMCPGTGPEVEIDDSAATNYGEVTA